MKRLIPLFPLIFTLLCLGSCASYEFSNKHNGEQTSMNVLNFEDPLTLQQVIDKNNPELSRGLITTDILIEGANLAIQGVKSLIDKSQERFNQGYLGGLNNLKFYATNSSVGMLDPDNISFRGFEFTRTFMTKKEKREVAVFLRFVIDEDKLEDIYFNSKFYLELDSISIEYSKVKINEKKWYLPWSWFVKKNQDIHLDLEMEVLANWIDEKGEIHSGVPFGSFTLPLRDIPMNHDDSTRNTYFKKLSGSPLIGACYTIPRSTTYCTGKDGNLKPCFGRGDFNIALTATETSKSDFVTKKLNQHSDDLFNSINPNDLIKAFDKGKK